MRLLTFWTTHAGELLGMLERHILLVLLSTAVAVIVGIPLGIVASHRPRVGKPLVALASVGQTIPSLALLGFLLPLPFIGGVGPRVAVVALIVCDTAAAVAASADPRVRAFFDTVAPMTAPALDA